MPPSLPKALTTKLSKFTVPRIQQILVSIGAATTGGSKESKLDRLTQSLLRPRIPLVDSFSPSSTAASSKKAKAREKDASIKAKEDTPVDAAGHRILSIDMGIKNLAFCVCDVTLPSSPSTGSGTLNVVAWRCLDLLAEPVFPSPSPSSSQDQPPSDDADPFHPSTLAPRAYYLLSELLDTYQPATILIEHQRWRSMGGKGVLQWTIRVNTLESIFYGVLTAVRMERVRRWVGEARAGASASASLTTERVKGEGSSGASKSSQTRTPAFSSPQLPNVHPVSPSRVSSFWIPSVSPPDDDHENSDSETSAEENLPPTQGTKPVSQKGKSKATLAKQKKMKLVGNWMRWKAVRAPALPIDGAEGAEVVEDEGAGVKKGKSKKGKASKDGTYEVDMQLNFAPEPERVRKLFLSKEMTANAEQSKEKEKDRVQLMKAMKIKKRDDLADCLLQAAAWAQWEVNRRKFLEGAEKQKDS
ncbi:ribonuclease H-like protein [Aulographum hederae CBS 113979]|uniref:Ribonuclease H-like protein n=1 Tax=Aulographum hederae CBS 113979 TaxID=1176131 RepID=A0A6G1GQB0_9PEZI|nr:ribonuclease H-like protein [Aulographum hederae CBS 113979]